jgi:hypothetical protein
VPYESGKYKFCLRLNQEKTGSRYVLSREVLWDLHVGQAENHSENVKEHDTQASDPRATLAGQGPGWAGSWLGRVMFGGGR